MGERQVTVDGVTYPLSPPFMVLATQNPIEHEGTYPLPRASRPIPHAQSLGYPACQAELEILDRPSDIDHLDELAPVINRDDPAAMTAIARAVFVAPGVRDYLVDLVDASRRHGHLLSGCPPGHAEPPGRGPSPGSGRRAALRHSRRPEGTGRPSPGPSGPS